LFGRQEFYCPIQSELEFDSHLLVTYGLISHFLYEDQEAMPEDNHYGSDASPADVDEGEDRRVAHRFSCNMQTTGHILGPRGGNSWVATITNISATGIGLVHRCRVKPGTVLVIKLQGKSQKLSRPLPVRVMHATAQENDEWLLGCAFVRKISEEDLQSLF
jgi:hypothetical protein